jgi:hypothetical protein
MDSVSIEVETAVNNNNEGGLMIGAYFLHTSTANRYMLISLVLEQYYTHSCSYTWNHTWNIGRVASLSVTLAT